MEFFVNQYNKLVKRWQVTRSQLLRDHPEIDPSTNSKYLGRFNERVNHGGDINEFTMKNHAQTFSENHQNLSATQKAVVADEDSRTFAGLSHTSPLHSKSTDIPSNIHHYATTFFGNETISASGNFGASPTKPVVTHRPSNNGLDSSTFLGSGSYANNTAVSETSTNPLLYHSKAPEANTFLGYSSHINSLPKVNVPGMTSNGPPPVPQRGSNMSETPKTFDQNQLPPPVPKRNEASTITPGINSASTFIGNSGSSLLYGRNSADSLVRTNFNGPVGTSIGISGKNANHASGTFIGPKENNGNNAAATFVGTNENSVKSAAATFVGTSGHNVNHASGTFAGTSTNSVKYVASTFVGTSGNNVNYPTGTFVGTSGNNVNYPAGTFVGTSGNNVNYPAGTFAGTSGNNVNNPAKTFVGNNLNYAGSTFVGTSGSNLNHAATTFVGHNQPEGAANCKIKPSNTFVGNHSQRPPPPPPRVNLNKNATPSTSVNNQLGPNLSPGFAIRPSSPLVNAQESIILAKRLQAENLKHAERNRVQKMAIDCCFLMDLTGTMRVWIEQTKKTIVSIMNTLQEKYSVDTIIKVSFVGYSDYNNDTPPVSKTVWRRYDGEDVPEDVMSGLDKVLQLNWSAKTKILIHIADDPAHNKEFHDFRKGFDRYLDINDPSGRGPKELYQMLGEIANKGIDYHFFHLDDNTKKMEEKFDLELKKYGSKLSVHFIGDDPEGFVPQVLKVENLKVTEDLKDLNIDVQNLGKKLLLEKEREELNKIVLDDIDYKLNNLLVLRAVQLEAIRFHEKIVQYEASNVINAEIERKLIYEKISHTEDEEQELVKNFIDVTSLSKILKKLRDKKKILKEENLKLKEASKESFIKKKIVDIFNDFEIQVFELANPLMRNLKFYKEVNNKIQKDILEKQNIEKQRLALEERNLQDDHANKIIPWLISTNYEWDLEVNVTMEVFERTSANSIFDDIINNKHFKDICRIRKVNVFLRMMSKPFDSGTYRYAYYAMDQQGTKYVIKHFKVQEDFQNSEEKCASNTSKAYFVCGLLGNEFTQELSLIGIDSSIRYTPSWPAKLILANQKKPNENMEFFSQKTLMIERSSYVADGNGGELMSAYSHFTYARSKKLMMVSDNQGHYEEKMMDGGKRKELFVLTDPVIHVPDLNLSTAKLDSTPLLMDLSHPLDGNRRKDGINEFALTHTCGPICNSLMLKKA
ncbi:hypothetical protein HK099_000910 [Clydaea vesicula]|uniref:Alpha-type protein kinase domain-containing protein n=1 Tax=Clydaea vesicula TaxID=447962 RepID=A0AAD5Y211_9FUNG|nr:hypothetical protein HK099_000910 [Clydaea vesicula]